MYCKYLKGGENNEWVFVLIVAKCIVNPCQNNLWQAHFQVLIVAKCIVN